MTNNVVECRSCGGDVKVTKTDKLDNGRIRRQKKCLSCGIKFVTWEVTAKEYSGEKVNGYQYVYSCDKCYSEDLTVGNTVRQEDAVMREKSCKSCRNKLVTYELTDDAYKELRGKEPAK